MKKVGAVTIGQSPRDDILRDVEDILGKEMELVQAGALDDMTLEEVQVLRPDGIGNTLVSRMRDGTAVELEEQKILPLMQRKIDELESARVQAVLIMCTGEFPEVFHARVPLIYPSKLICNIVASLKGVSCIGIITPEKSQFQDIERKWGRIVPKVVPVQWNPYLESRPRQAAEALRDAGVDLAVMDCFGYSQEMRCYAAEIIGKPVILSRRIAIEVVKELV